MQVDYCGAEDLDAAPVPLVWCAPPPTAAALGLADALRHQRYWTGGGGAGGAGAGETCGAPALVELDPASDEFCAVAAHFCAAGNPADQARRWRGEVRVESVQRVENGALHALHAARRAHVARQCAAHGAGGFDPVRMERWVFHGTGGGGALGCIVDEGFRPLLAGSRNGAAYGRGERGRWGVRRLPERARACAGADCRSNGPSQTRRSVHLTAGQTIRPGTYFARDAWYSDRYARPEADGSRTMILAAAVPPPPLTRS